MIMRLHDTFSKTKSDFELVNGKKVALFVCGPTVYDYSHIGHARTYIAFDAFVKYLRHKGCTVRYVQNITDIDDKIIARAAELKQTPKDLARNFETEYFHDMEMLGIDSVDRYARATDYILQIISQVKRLIDKGYAYEIKNDGVYYDISKFQDYGKLSGRTAEQAEDAVSRIDESVNKKNKGDFALWKFSKPDEPKWPSPWGEGRPGWHIEDTAITESELGEQYDIHGGARDLIFPHHESEIAQMEALSAKAPLARYWMHTGFLTVNGEKMSKSLGNFITIHEFCRKRSKETLRLFILSSHYRSPIDYSEAAMNQAEANAERLGEFYGKIKNLSGSDPDRFRLSGVTSIHSNKFFDELDDDFNTPKALAALFELVRETNALIAADKLHSKDAGQVLEFLATANKLFGIIPETETQPIPQKVLRLAKEREKLRLEKKWKAADKIRSEIETNGYTVEDTVKGPIVKSL